MANNTYVVNEYVSAGDPTLEISDDGTGSDWLSITGTYADATDITLAWSRNDGHATAAGGTFFVTGPGAGRLIVNGLIENARGSDSADFIIGNEVANRLMGDQKTGGVGGNDTIDGGAGADRIWGGAGDDSLLGAADADTIYGGAGNDTISGGDGIDVIEGGRGADSLAGGSDIGDTVSYAGSHAGVVVDLTAGSGTTGRGGDAAGDWIYGFTDIIGSAYGDRLTDTVQGEVLSGTNTNRFYGGGGNDILKLGGGNDTGYGGADNDALWGQAGNDRLDGGEGADTLVGGLGADTLTGGAGADVFRFYDVSESTAAAAGRDRITDFEHDLDKIDLRSIDANEALDGNQAFTFIGASGFHGVAGELRSAVSGGNLLLYGDTDGDKAVDFALLVVGHPVLDAGDLLR